MYLFIIQRPRKEPSFYSLRMKNLLTSWQKYQPIVSHCLITGEGQLGFRQYLQAKVNTPMKGKNNSTSQRRYLSCVAPLRKEANKGIQWHSVLAGIRFTFNWGRAGTGTLCVQKQSFQGVVRLIIVSFWFYKIVGSQKSFSLLCLRRPVQFLHDDSFSPVEGLSSRIMRSALVVCCTVRFCCSGNPLRGKAEDNTVSAPSVKVKAADRHKMKSEMPGFHPTSVTPCAQSEESAFQKSCLLVPVSFWPIFQTRLQGVRR